MDTSDEWQWVGEEMTCDHCGRVCPCVEGPDPFVAEVHPETPNPRTWWCRACWRKRADDV